MDNTVIGTEKDILFYNDENGNVKIEVVLKDDNVWLNVNAIANLFDVQRPAITKHINNRLLAKLKTDRFYLENILSFI